LAGDWALASIAGSAELAALYPANSMRWVGGGAMTVAVAYSLVKFMGPRAATVGGEKADDSLLEIEPGVRRGLGLCIALGVAILIAWLVSADGATPFAFAMTGAILVMAMLMVTLGAILSLQIGSSASPVSGTIFVTTLVLCLVALAVGRASIEDVPILTALLVGACVAVCTANDSSQDYKTLQLCGVAPRDGFKAQIWGLVAGCIVVPLSIYVAHEAYGLGTNQLTAPQGEMFATLVDGLLIQEALPWHPILLGLAVGAVAVGMDVVASRRGLQLPAMALAVGIYLPGYLGVGILIGALCRAFGERAREKDTGRRERTHESILAAAGLITGAAALELLLGIAILFRFDPSKLSLFSSAQEAGEVAILGVVQVCAGVAGILVLGGLLFHNARRGGTGASE
ncbi:MAG: OPT/YSL family transporter, partial [Planctomycetota bacterium]|nr:OPT/YSL family transporter [Planctomycetota bacterium]